MSTSFDINDRNRVMGIGKYVGIEATCAFILIPKGVNASGVFYRSNGVKALWPNGSGVCAIDVPGDKLEVPLGPFYANLDEFLEKTWTSKAYAIGMGARWLAFVDDDLHPHLWDLERRREVFLSGGASLRINSFAFSPDNDLLAASGDGPTVRLWNPADGSSRGELSDSSNDLRAVAFSPDGRHLIVGGDDDRVYIYARDKEVQVEPYRETNRVSRRRLIPAKRCEISDGSPPTGGDFSSDGRTAYWSGFDGVVRVVSTGNCRVTGRWPLHNRPIVWLHRSGEFLVSRDSESLLITRASDGNIVNRVAANGVISVAAAENVPVAAIIDRNDLVHITSIPSLKNIRDVPARSSRPVLVGLSAQGDYAVIAYEDSSFGVWSVDKGVWTMNGMLESAGGGPLRHVDGGISVSRDGARVVHAGVEGATLYEDRGRASYDPETRVSTQLLFEGAQWGNGCFSPIFTADGSAAIFGCKQNRRIIGQNLSTWAELPGDYRRTMRFVSLAQDSSYIMSDDGGDAVVIDRLADPMRPDKVPFTIEFSNDGGMTMSGLPAPVTVLVFSRDNSSLFAGLQDGTVLKWSRQSKQMDEFVLAHASAVASIAIRADSDKGFFTTDVAGDVRQYNQYLESSSWPRPSLKQGRTEAAILSDKLILGEDRGRLEYFDPFGVVVATAPFVKLIGDSEGKSFVTIQTNGFVRRWSGIPPTGVVIDHYDGALPSVLSISPGGDVVLTAGGAHSVRLRNVETNTSYTLDASHGREISAAALSLGGKVGALGDMSGNSTVFVLSNGKLSERELEKREGHAVTSIALTRNGRYVATAWTDGILKVRRVHSEQDQAAASVHPARKTPIEAPAEIVTEGASHDVAILIGLDRYQDKKLLPPPGAGRDADAFEEFVRTKLGWRGATSVRIEGEAATMATLSKYLMTWLPDHTFIDSRICIYFSGMGGMDVQSRAPFLVPYDGDPSYLNETALPMAALLRRLAALPSRDVRVVVDAAFVGGGPRHAALTAMRPLVSWSGAFLPVGRNTILILADDGHGRAEDISVGGGYLTSVLMDQPDGTDGAFAEGWRITAADLSTYLEKNSRDGSDSSGGRQHPIVITQREADLKVKVWRKSP